MALEKSSSLSFNISGGLSISASSRISSGTSSNISSRSNSSISSLTATYGTYDKKEENNIESILLTCETTLKDRRFTGAIGRIFRVKCPTCSLVKRPIYGSYIYHPLSSICKAASHSGNISSIKSGYVIVELVAGKKIYNGSLGLDGTISGTFSGAEISFRTKVGTSPTPISCTDAPNKEPFLNAQQGKKFVVLCPKNCGKEKVEIFGSEVYSDTSSICISAIHAGIMNDLGGEIELLIDGPQTFFKSTKSFGIISKPRDSYIRSFRFIGVKSSIFFKYKDDYAGKITDKWELVIGDEVEKIESNQWSYEEKPIKIMEEEQKVTKYIVHRGEIKSKLKNAYGTFISLRNAQWSKGRVKTNFLFKDKRAFALLFKFVDKSNYYALEFNPENPKNSLNLICRIDGSVSVLQTKQIELKVEMWYRIELLMNNDKITIKIQNDKIRESKVYFEFNAEKISRGTIAIATNGNSDLYVNGIEIDDYIPHASKKINNKNKRSWIELLKHTDEKTKKKYCQKTFNGESEEITRCMNPQYFCRLKCDDDTPSIENILNFQCYKQCLKKIFSETNHVKIQKEVWVPKVHSLVDFLPKNEKHFSPATIESVREKIFKGKTIKTYNVRYYDSAGNILVASATYPSSNLFKCGSKLLLRKDCNPN